MPKLPKFNEEKLKQLLWFTGGAICGLAMLSISKAAVPNVPTGVTDDSAIYQNLSEIQIAKDSVPSFDSGISRLSRMENHYRDNLPGLSRRANLRGPISRISRQQYRYRGGNGRVSAFNEEIPAPAN